MKLPGKAKANAASPVAQCIGAHAHHTRHDHTYKGTLADIQSRHFCKHSPDMPDCKLQLSFFSSSTVISIGLAAAASIATTTPPLFPPVAGASTLPLLLLLGPLLSAITSSSPCSRKLRLLRDSPTNPQDATPQRARKASLPYHASGLALYGVEVPRAF